MKNNKILFLVLGALVLAGCDPTTNSSKTSGSSPANSSPVSTSTSTSSTNHSSSSTGGSSINHIDPLVREIENPSKTRKYNESYDLMLDDFSSDTLGTNENAEKIDNKLRVLVDSSDTGTSGFFPDSPDKAIYKMATGSYPIETYDGIGFKIRKVGEGTLDYSNLVLALRGADTWKTYPITLSEALDPDMESLPSLTNEFQDVIIAPGQTIEDDTTEYETLDGGNSGVTVLSKILGFHLYAQGECAQMIEIEEVFLMKAGEKTVLDNFAREAVNKIDDTCWWRDSTGLIIREGVRLNNGASYTINADVTEYSNLVLNVLGDTTGTVITPVTSSGRGTGVGWANFKDSDGVSVSNAVNGAYYPLVINLEQSGIATTDLVGFEISSASDVYFSQAFLTNLREKEVVTAYPRLDTANAVVFDSFTRTQNSIDTTYEAASVNPVILDSGLYYSIAYAGADKVSVDGDALVFQAQADYTQVTEGSENGRTTQRYAVFSMKLGEGTTLDQFRISDGKTVVYANDWYAGSGLKSIPVDLDSYPYIDTDGYTYYVIDLVETGLDFADSMDIYYTGEGTLSIDSIFFADEYSTTQKASLISEETVVNFDGATYGYLYGGYYPGSGRYYVTLKGDGTAALDSFRLEYNGSTIYANNGLKIYNADGTAHDYTQPLPIEETTLYIDLVESGFEVGVANHVHLHFGQDPEGTSGTLTFVDKGYTYEAGFNRAIGEAGSVNFDGVTYGYKYGGYILGTCSMLKVVVKGDGTAALDSFRLEYNGSTIYANNGLKIYNADGTAHDYTQPLPTEETTLYIDLVESGFEVGVAEHVHFHFGQNPEGTSGTITFVSTFEYEETIPYAEVINQYVEYVEPSEGE